MTACQALVRGVPGPRFIAEFVSFGGRPYRYTANLRVDLRASHQRRTEFLAGRIPALAVFSILLASMPMAVSGQDAEPGGLPVRTDTLTIVGAGPFILHPYIEPGSVRVWVNGRALSATEYTVDAGAGFLYLDQAPSGESGRLVVMYRYVPIFLSGAYRRWPPYDDSRAAANRGRASAGRASATGFPAPAAGQALRRSGSITRGISTGTGRDVAIESGLRLEVDGEIAEGLELRAVLTDENTPILPEGTTQRLNDFDRVFIELQSAYGSVRMGDVDGRIDAGRFGAFNRKLQGVTATAILPAGRGSLFGGGAVTAAGATTRGVFRVQDIDVLDGVQGPYRLEGENGERFIIVLPGSEIVYLDGIRLERGATSDYVVDYATGEITFTPRRIIGADRRISVEFQYTTRQYTRTLLAADAQAGFGPSANGRHLLTLGVSAIRQADGDQFSEEFALSAADSAAIILAGDENAFRSGAISVAYDPEALYTQYVVNVIEGPAGEPIEIYEVVRQAPPDTVQVFRVTFSRVGSGLGDYGRTGFVTNGIAYEYVGPGNGEYAPIRPLPKPALHQLVDLRGAVRPGRHFRISGEWAASRLDLNRLSAFDSNDDEGSAYELELALEPVALAAGSLGDLNISAAARRYFRDVNFASFERIRPVEYGRRWNIQHIRIDAARGLFEFGDETVEELDVAVTRSDSSRVLASAGRLDLGDAFSAKRLEGGLRLRDPRFPWIDYRIERIESEDEHAQESGEWTRQLGRLSGTLFSGALRPYVELESEELNQRETATGQPVEPSLRFLESRAGVAWLRERYAIGLDVERRDEERVAPDGLSPLDAWTVSANLTASPGRALHSELQVGYRKTDAEGGIGAGNSGPSESVIVHLNGRWGPVARPWNVSWLYQAQTERSATLQEIYIRTGQERGEYVWVDENDDGVTQLEEFLPETTPDEGLYVRTFLPGDSLEAVTSVRGRVRLEISPNRSPSGALRGFLAGLDAVTLVDVEEKSRTPQRTDLYLLRTSRFLSEHTLSGRIRIRQDVALFRNNRRFDVNLGVQSVRSLTELAAGEESRRSELGSAAFAFRASDQWTFRLTVDRTLESVESASFATRSYRILATELVPSISWRPGPRIQLSLSPTISRKAERLAGGGARLVRAPLDVRYSVESRFDLRARFEASSVALDGVYNGRTAFELTDGRGPGRSYLWRLSVQNNLSEVLTATASYDGRAPEGRPTIHTARFQLSARF